MIRKLRLRFVLITMLSVVLVLGAIILTINVMNYSEVRGNADKILDMLDRNGGGFDGPDFGGNPNPHPNRFNEETPFETRFFTVKYNSDETVEVNTNHIAAIQDAQAISMADAILLKNRARGYESIYRYKVCDSSNGVMIIFMDCTRQLETANSFLLYSLIISLCGVLCVFILVFFLSKRVVLPIALSYERQKRFITNAGHELKTPLSIISANNELIELETGESESTAAISKQISRMASMVKNLTLLARLDEEEKISSLKSFCISDTLENVVDSISAVFKSKGIEVITDIQENVLYKGEEGLITQLFQVLLDNAVKYCISKVGIRLYEVSSHIHIEIKNDAKEIPLGSLDYCFERFYRSSSSRAESIEGSGIGLSIAKEIVNLHKAEIHAVGLENSVFQIKLVL